MDHLLAGGTGNTKRNTKQMARLQVDGQNLFDFACKQVTGAGYSVSEELGNE